MSGQYGHLRTDKSVVDTRDDIREEFARWPEIDDFDIMPGKRKGMKITEAVIEYWMDGTKHDLRCDEFEDYRVNLRALYLLVKPMRLAASRGILKELARAVAGFLPPPSGEAAQTAPLRSWWEVLGVTPSTDGDVIKGAYDVLARKHHSDTGEGGGDEAAMKELNRAMEEYREQS